MNPTLRATLSEASAQASGEGDTDTATVLRVVEWAADNNKMDQLAEEFGDYSDLYMKGDTNDGSNTEGEEGNGDGPDSQDTDLSTTGATSDGGSTKSASPTGVNKGANTT